MPLVERYNDWKTADRSFDNPHTLEFDHRIGADAAAFGTGLANIEDNVKATCVITILKPEFGWSYVGGYWVYDPTHTETNLKSIWRNNLPDCVQHDKYSLKNCFCNATTNSGTAYIGPEAEVLSDKIDALEWPRDTTEFVSHFAPAGQYMIGPKFCSAYHLGNGYVGTAGHCLNKALADNQLGELRVVFNWVGDVVSKKTFAELEVFEIERVALCDTHGPAPFPTNLDETARWARRWDSTILKLNGAPRHFSHLKTARLATRPPEFGTPVYNIGSPLGNSGGPVFDTNTGLVVGHTSSTQDAVFESDIIAIEGWANGFAKHSKNYTIAAEINAFLEKQEPNNSFYRVHPKFLRTLTGMPRASPLIKCATNMCPSDLGPNKELQTAGIYQAVFSRHHFDSKDVHLRNATGRVDRSALFMTPLNVLLSDYDACILTIKFSGKTEAFGKPSIGISIIITIGAADWVIRNQYFHKDTSSGIPSRKDVWSTTLDLTARRHEIPTICLDAHRGLIDWTAIRLDQPTRNPPSIVGLSLSIRRPGFPFPVNKTWPPERPDVTDKPEEAELRWQEETFEFVTTAGDTPGASQTDRIPETFEEGNCRQGVWTWEAPISRVWTSPPQPSQGLRDPLMDDFDELLA